MAEQKTKHKFDKFPPPTFDFSDSTAKVVRWRRPVNSTMALVVEPSPTSRLLRVLIMDSMGIQVSEINRAEMGFMTVDDYQVHRMVEKLLHAGEQFGITAQANEILRNYKNRPLLTINLEDR